MNLYSKVLSKYIVGNFKKYDSVKFYCYLTFAKVNNDNVRIILERPSFIQKKIIVNIDFSH